MGRPGPKKTQRYGVEFKRAAVQLSHRPGIEVKAVADALDIHPYMLSRWRKEFREGRLRPRAGQPEPRSHKAAPEREVRRLQQLEREHRMLQEEHAPPPAVDAERYAYEICVERAVCVDFPA